MAQDGYRAGMTEPSGAGRRPIRMNRNRWVALVAVVPVIAVLAVVIGALMPWSADRGAAPPASQRESLGFDGAYADPDPMVLVVRYGDSGCPSEAVRHDVVQQARRVVVTLTRTAMPTDRACTAVYVPKLVRVTLAAPLAGREVIDGSRQAPVPLSTGTPPFG